MNRPYHARINQEYKDNKFRYDSVVSDIMLVHMWSISPYDMIAYIEDVNMELSFEEEDAEDSIYYFYDIH
tara:strand:+ start:553 stop:762 length:210 start_codon:yes stop_codon:yes gene_type:complete